MELYGCAYGATLASLYACYGRKATEQPLGPHLDLLHPDTEEDDDEDGRRGELNDGSAAIKIQTGRR